MTLDRNLIDSGATIERTLTLRELGEILKEHRDLVVEVDSPDGFVKVSEFLHQGTRPCVRVTFDNGQTLGCSIDHRLEVATDAAVNLDPHPLQITNLDKVTWEGEPQTITEIDARYLVDPSLTPEPPKQRQSHRGMRAWIEAQWVSYGDNLLADCGHPVCVLELEHIGTQEVFDLSIDHEASRGAHRFYANGLSVHNCVACGACDTITEVKHVTTTPYKETGATDYWRISNVVRDNQTAYKLLVEARIKPGRHSAVQPRWLKFALTSALLRASDGELVEPNIHERFSHSRQGYRIKQHDFKSLISGSFLAEFQFSGMRRVRRHHDGTPIYNPKTGDPEFFAEKRFHLTQTDVERLLARVNDYVSPSFEISSIQLKPADYVLKNHLRYAYTIFRFDSRRVAGVDLATLQRQIQLSNEGHSLLYKSQHMEARSVLKTVVKDFDQSKILNLTAKAADRYTTTLRMFCEVQDAHPLIVLAGFLGIVKQGRSRPRSYRSLVGTQIEILGFYQMPDAPLAGSLWDQLSDDQPGDAWRCPVDGSTLPLNVVTNRPFGNAPYEQDPMLMERHGRPVGLHQHMAHAL
jgi:hypothetical protein